MPTVLIVLGFVGGIVLLGLALYVFLFDPGPGRQMMVLRDKKFGSHVVETQSFFPDDF